MDLQVMFLRKTFVADVADERLLAGVDAHVTLQVFFTGEIRGTNFAVETALDGARFGAGRMALHVTFVAQRV